MPILALDNNGRLYMTSRDRADGLGVEDYPECVSQGDVTLGSAYLKSQAAQNAQVIKMRRDQAAIDLNDQRQAAVHRQIKERENRRLLAEIRMLENPMLQQGLMRKALSMGCECDHKTSMSGYALSANGKKGFYGMSRDQQVIHHAALGVGENVAYRVDPTEKRQHEMRLQAERLMRLKSIR